LRREVIRLMMAGKRKHRPGLTVDDVTLVILSMISLIMALLSLYILLVKK
jgi:hypothetical protein